MSKLSAISILFYCKLCSCSFPHVDEFIAHKEQQHSSEFKNIKCIVFEEQHNVAQGSDIPIQNNSVLISNESSQLFESLSDELNFDRNGREPLLSDLRIDNLAKLNQNPPSVIVTNCGPILRLRSQGSHNSTFASTSDVSDSVSAPNVMVNIKREPDTDEFSNVDSYAQDNVNICPAPAIHGDSINNNSSINTYESTNPLLDNLIINAPIKIEPPSIQIQSSDIDNPFEDNGTGTDHLLTNGDANNIENEANKGVNDDSGSDLNFNLQDLKPVLLSAAALDVNFDLLLHFQTDSNSNDNEFGVNWPTAGTPRTEYEPLLQPPLPEPARSVNSKLSGTASHVGSSNLASVKVEVDQDEESEVDSDSDSDSDTADAGDDSVASHCPPGFFGGEHSLSMSMFHGDQSNLCFSNELGPSFASSSSSELASSINYSLVSSSQPHRDKGNIRCPYCAKEKFYTEGPSKKSHMLKFHSNLKIQCSICRVQNLFWPSSMEKHIANSHNPTRANFMCSRCSRNMKNACTLKRHQKGCMNKSLLPGFEDSSSAS